MKINWYEKKKLKVTVQFICKSTRRRNMILYTILKFQRQTKWKPSNWDYDRREMRQIFAKGKQINAKDVTPSSQFTPARQKIRFRSRGNGMGTLLLLGMSCLHLVHCTSTLCKCAQRSQGIIQRRQKKHYHYSFPESFPAVSYDNKTVGITNVGYTVLHR